MRKSLWDTIIVTARLNAAQKIIEGNRDTIIHQAIIGNLSVIEDREVDLIPAIKNLTIVNSTPSVKGIPQCVHFVNLIEIDAVNT